MKTKFLILSIAALCLSAAPAVADLQSVLDNITLAPVAGDSSVNVATDMLLDGTDDLWHITAVGGSVSTVVIELAGFAEDNAFGAYDPGTGQSVQLFAGSAVAGDQAVLSIHADGSVFVDLQDTGVDFSTSGWFGFYLDAPDNGGVVRFYSDTTLNSDNVDHMYAIQGTNKDTVQLPGLVPGVWTDNEFILGWEDLLGGGDLDYDDFVVMIESVMVPVPAAVLLGLLGLGVAGLKLRKFA